MLTDAELTQLRTDAENWLMDTCTIQTLTQTVDAMGGIVLTYANTYTGIACRVDPMSGGATGNEAVRNLALESASYYQISLPYTQVINANNRVIHNSVTYEVVRTIEGNSQVTLTRAILTRID